MEAAKNGLKTLIRSLKLDAAEGVRFACDEPGLRDISTAGGLRQARWPRTRKCRSNLFLKRFAEDLLHIVDENKGDVLK